MKRIALASVAVFATLPILANWDFDAGADFRVREELMENTPGLPGRRSEDGSRQGAGVLMPQVRRKFTNHVRFRPRIWAELKADEHWRIFTRLTDEFRWCPEPYLNAHTFPDELILDNLVLEGKDLFEDFFDLSVGRQDIFGLYGLDHVFVDGTPGDGSRTTYADMVRAAFKFTADERLDLFFIHTSDKNEIRWGTDRSEDTMLNGFGGNADLEMDDWGGGAIWSGRSFEWLKYQLFVIEKYTQGFHRDGVSHPGRRRETVGTKLVPQLNDEWSLQLEGMGQIGKNDDGDWLTGWSTYAGVNWKSARTGWRPFGKLGFHTMSGDRNASEQDGGNHAWDPLWARGVNDSEMFLYGTHYGAAWWSNMMYLKFTLGVDLGHNHKLAAHAGPMFSQVADGMGGGSGNFKGFLSQIRYDFPIWSADKAKRERFEVFGHLVAEFFNPGDYFETDKPAYFVRWQVDFRF